MSLFKSLFGPRPARFVEVAPLGARFEVPGGETILEAALRNGVAFPHNCTVGTCGSCKCRLVEGKVGALTDFGYTLSSEEIAAGFILACQAVVKSPLTRLEVVGPPQDCVKPQQFAGRLIGAEPLTHDILRITLDLDRPVQFLAGQYANLKYPNISRARNYSFADAPTDGGLKQVNFFIRKVPKGVFTEALFAGHLSGIPIEVEAPHGNFGLQPGTAPMICVAGGSGLAPILSVLEDALRRRIRRPCAFLFGARTTADLYCLDRVERIKREWPDRFVFLPVLSDEPADSIWQGARGLVTQFVTGAMPGTDFGGAEGYLCGPPGMIDAGIACMTEAGMKIDAIRYDKFTDESHISKLPQA